MDRLRASITAAGCSGVLLWTVLVWGQSATSGFSSVEQAKQGQSVLREKCAACHGDNLDGGQEAPALKGEAFWSEWDQQTARALYSRIISTMPPDGPGTLDEKDVIGLVAFIVQQNGVPPGTKSIQTANELNSMKLQRPK